MSFIAPANALILRNRKLIFVALLTLTSSQPTSERVARKRLSNGAKSDHARTCKRHHKLPYALSLSGARRPEATRDSHDNF